MGGGFFDSQPPGTTKMLVPKSIRTHTERAAVISIRASERSQPPTPSTSTATPSTPSSVFSHASTSSSRTVTSTQSVIPYKRKYPKRRQQWSRSDGGSKRSRDMGDESDASSDEDGVPANKVPRVQLDEEQEVLAEFRQSLMARRPDQLELHTQFGMDLRKNHPRDAHVFQTKDMTPSLFIKALARHMKPRIALYHEEQEAFVAEEVERLLVLREKGVPWKIVMTDQDLRQLDLIRQNSNPRSDPHPTSEPRPVRKSNSRSNRYGGEEGEDMDEGENDDFEGMGERRDDSDSCSTSSGDESEFEYNESLDDESDNELPPGSDDGEDEAGGIAAGQSAADGERGEGEEDDDEDEDDDYERSNARPRLRAETIDELARRQFEVLSSSKTHQTASLAAGMQAYQTVNPPTARLLLAFHKLFKSPPKSFPAKRKQSQISIEKSDRIFLVKAIVGSKIWNLVKGLIEDEETARADKAREVTMFKTTTSTTYRRLDAWHREAQLAILLLSRDNFQVRNAYRLFVSLAEVTFQSRKSSLRLLKKAATSEGHYWLSSGQYLDPPRRAAIRVHGFPAFYDYERVMILWSASSTPLATKSTSPTVAITPQWPDFPQAYAFKHTLVKKQALMRSPEMIRRIAEVVKVYNKVHRQKAEVKARCKVTTKAWLKKKKKQRKSHRDTIPDIIAPFHGQGLMPPPPLPRAGPNGSDSQQPSADDAEGYAGGYGDLGALLGFGTAAVEVANEDEDEMPF